VDRPIIRQKNGLTTLAGKNQNKDKIIQPPETKKAGRHIFLDPPNLQHILTPYQKISRKFSFFLVILILTFSSNQIFHFKT
jgi:hypothetical protein